MPTLPSTGPADYTTPRSARPLTSATSTTLSSTSLSSLSTTGKAISFILCSHRSSIDMRTFSQGGDELFVSLVVAPDICGKNGFIGVAYLTIGSLCIFLVVAFMVLYLLKPWTLGDPSYLSWNRNPDGH
ncbi:hypothetical protein ZIOFF_063278 [Zingiber officinale]|uniref:Uncharacterized protein n=1 Tax=Zingiber officinale TaxID=94328 RepID=A0A8J5KG28_ZINOF|nr:hypothetical protein ZIOFF_063278 [Zingiber officinale]